jgi:glycosyltransferase involved in cell wall biosynthesis
LPDALPVGTSTAVFCVGVCFHAEQRIDQLAILVDGVSHEPAAFGMPRPDVSASSEHPGSAGHHHLSGFWGTVPIPARDRPGTVTVAVAARLANGVELASPLGTIDVLAQEPAAAPEAQPLCQGPGLIAVCMATFEPDRSLFEAQIRSLQAQSDDRWICLISDDCSDREHFEQILQVVGDDRRFAISRSDNRLGFYRNFERALRMVPTEAELVALCDQDDRWHPDKLGGLRDYIGDAVLVYSDQRLVDASGAVLRDTLWRGRRNNFDSIASMLIANTITGAAMLFRREMLEIALPFPDTPGFQFHDHWLAVVALAGGRVAYVDRPMYDYVQHAGAVFGDVTHGSKSESASVLRRLGQRLRHPARRAGSWRAAYFYGYLAREVQAQALLARCGNRLTASKRRALRLFLACDSSALALGWLALRPVRCLLGHTETLGSELELAQGIVWKRLAQIRARHLRRPGGPLSDAQIPPPQSFTQRRLRRWRADV